MVAFVISMADVLEGATQHSPVEIWGTDTSCHTPNPCREAGRCVLHTVVGEKGSDGNYQSECE